MGAIAYYVGGRDSISAEVVDEIGLGYTIDGKGVSQFDTARGPDGGRGVYFAAGGVKFKHAELEWSLYPGREDVFIGINRASPPKPSELARDDLVSGHMVKLGDGALWEIPIARYYTGTAGFPRRLTWKPDGWYHGEVIEAYKALWDDACKFWGLLLEAGSKREDEGPVSIVFDGNDEADLASRSIGINYRVGPAELSMLGLLTTETKSDVCMALVDFPSVQKLQEAGPPN